MRHALAVSLLVACGADAPRAVPPKPPNNEMINGEYERHPPDGTAAMRLRGDGSFRIAKTKADLDKDPPIVEGHYQLDKDTLTLNAEKGACAGDASVYKIVLSKVGIRFTKQTETCTARASMDGTTWFRSR